MELSFALLLFLLSIFALGFNKSSPRSESLTQPAALFLFEDHSPPASCDPIPEPTGKHAAVYTLLQGEEFALHRKDQLSLDSKEVSALTVHPASASVWIAGSEAHAYSAELCVSAGKLMGADAHDLLDAIRLSRSGDTLTVVGPAKYDPERPSRAELRIAAPREQPVNVDGTYSFVEIKDVTAAIRVRTTHARVRILHASGRVDAEASQFGIVDFAGDRGEVQLNAENEINLKITAQAFNGTLRATAKEAVRVIVPEGFSAPFEARVHRASDFICRVPFCDQIKHRRTSTAELFQFGSGDSALSLVSVGGRVIIDSLERLERAEETFKQEAAEQRAELARQADRINQAAGSIHSEADARQYIDLLFRVFAARTPTWIKRSTLDRVAQAEYAATVRGQFISEQRVADFFNRFEQQIGAPAWAHVTAEDLRNLRDGELAAAKSSWTRGDRNVWAMPNIYHVDSAGKLAPGCRAVEALKLLYTLRSGFANVLYARERVRQPSQMIEEISRARPAMQERRQQVRLAYAQARQYEQELRRTQDNYLRRHGVSAYEKLVRAMFEGVLP